MCSARAPLGVNLSVAVGGEERVRQQADEALQVVGRVQQRGALQQI